MFPIRRPRTPAPPVGLHLGPDGCRLVQLRPAAENHPHAGGPGRGPAHGRPLVTAALWLPLAEEARSGNFAARLASCAGLVRQALGSGRFVGNRVITSLPSAAVQVRTFRLPFLPDTAGKTAASSAREGLEAEANRQAREAFPSSAASVRVESVLAGAVRQEGGVRHEVISFAAREADVREYLGALSAAGAVVESLCAEPFALYRCAAAGPDAAAAGAGMAAVHVCADVTQIVVGRGGDVELVRKVDLGTAQLEAAVARKLGVTTQEARELRRRAGAAPEGDPVREAVLDATRAPAEDLAREVGLCLRYHAAGFRCAPPPCVRLLGPGAGDPHLAAVIASAVAVPVDAGSVFRSVDAGGVPGRDAADGAWAVAVGLALKALEPAAPSARAVVAAGPVREPVHA